jgi:hypothetical protein
MPKKESEQQKSSAQREVPIRWRDEVAEHDYAAAEAYLSLALAPAAVRNAVARLRKEKLVTRRANDILRASGLEAAALDDPGVVKDLIKVIEGKALSPILMVSSGKGETEIADGFHRVSLVYRVDPYGEIPLKLADMRSSSR